MTPPIIISKCCKTVMGCEKCVNEWYSGPDALIKMCPSRRPQRGYNETMLLRGFDNFITELQKVKMSGTVKIFQKLTCDRLLYVSSGSYHLLYILFNIHPAPYQGNQVCANMYQV